MSRTTAGETPRPSALPLHAIPDSESELAIYRQYLGLRSRSLHGLSDKVLQGIEFGAAERLRRHLDVSLTDFADIVQMAPRTLQRRRHAGRLQADESDRLLRAGRLFGLTVGLFEGNERAARDWLASPARALGGRSPLTVAKTDIGSREVENLIGRLEHGIPS